MENGVPMQLTGQALTQFRLGIDLVLSKWTMLQEAIDNQWGGPDSRQKTAQLPGNILSKFNQSTEPVCTVDIMYVIIGLQNSLYTVFDGDSIHEVAARIMRLHTECLEGNFTSIRRLMEAGPDFYI